MLEIEEHVVGTDYKDMVFINVRFSDYAITIINNKVHGSKFKKVRVSKKVRDGLYQLIESKAIELESNSLPHIRITRPDVISLLGHLDRRSLIGIAKEGITDTELKEIVTKVKEDGYPGVYLTNISTQIRIIKA